MPPRTTRHAPLAEFLTFAYTLADAAGAAIRPYFGAHGVVEEKSDASPVTIADRAAEQAMRTLIAQHYPEHEIYGEEFGLSDTSGDASVALYGASRSAAGVRPKAEGGVSPPSTENYTWVLDPIDGTRAFIAGKKEWGTLIALCENGVPILGVLNQPITGERWVGGRGMATQYSTHHASRITHHEIRTRACPSLAQASISSTSARYFTPPQAARFVKLAEQCAETIEDGDCYAYGLLALGARDLVVDAAIKPYDILALAPIVEGAGGLLTGWEGQQLTLGQCDKVLASGDAHCHQAALTLLVGG